MVALFGMGALAVELGNVYFKKAQNQRYADAAAIAAAVSYGATGNAAVLTNVATNAAQINGVPSSAVAVALVTSPSGSGNNAVQVTITTAVPLRLARAIGFQSSMNVPAAGWAEIKTASTACIVGLASSGNSVIENGGANVTGNGCAVGAKSNLKDHRRFEFDRASRLRRRLRFEHKFDDYDEADRQQHQSKLFEHF